MKHKMKHFLWNIIQGIIPVNEVISRRVGKGDPMCRYCGEDIESIEHMLFFCPSAQAVWERAPITWDGIKHLRNNFLHWWTEIIDASKAKHREGHGELTLNILWQIWKARNETISNKKE